MCSLVRGLLSYPGILTCTGCRCAGTAEQQLTMASKNDGTWGGQVGLLMGLSSSVLMWALLSENQDALLAQSINQASQYSSSSVREWRSAFLRSHRILSNI